MNEHELDLALADFGSTRVQPGAPQVLRQRIRTMPLPSGTKRRWLLHGPTWRFGSMFSATKFVVAGAIVALFGGILLAGVVTQPSEEAVQNVGASTSAESSTLPTVEVPAVIPEDIESGVLDTPLGPARWMHLSGDAGTVPDNGTRLPVPGGYVTLVGEGWECPQGQAPCAAALWFSPDLITWTRRSLPFVATSTDSRSLRMAGGEYWIADYDQGDVLWRSADAVAWEAVDLSGMAEPPSPEGIDWESWIPPHAVAASGDIVLVHREYGPAMRTSFLGLPADRFPDEMLHMERLDDGRYLVMENNPRERELGMIRLEGADGGVRVIDDETDAELAVIEGVGLDSIERWIDGWPEYGFALLHDDGLEAVELPDAGAVRFLSVIGNDDGFVANAVDSEGLIQTWTSPDGSSWTLGEPLGDDPGEPIANSSLWIEPHGLTVVTDLGEWHSADGIDWQQMRGLPSEYTARVGSSWVGLNGAGLVILPDDAEGYSVVGLSDLGLRLQSSDAAWMGRIGPNTIAIEAEAAFGGQGGHWIITFDDVPASDAGPGQ